MSKRALVATLLLLSAMAGQALADNSDSIAERKEAQNLLKRIHAAAQTLNYTGTFMYQQGSKVKMSRVTHVVDGRNELEKVETLDGRPRECTRTNEDRICYRGDTHVAVIEKRMAQDMFPALLADNTIDITEYYTVRKQGNERVAGYECQTLVLEPKDKLRYGYRLYAEKATGLLLRAQTLDDKREVIDQLTFASVVLGNVDKELTKSSYAGQTGWRSENNEITNMNLSAWAVKAMPVGFKRLREVHRTLPPSDDTPRHKAAREVSQIVYSDGLAGISIFIEPGSKDDIDSVTQHGATVVMGKHQGSFWLTIIGEVPVGAIRQIANSIEFNGKSTP